MWSECKNKHQTSSFDVLYLFFNEVLTQILRDVEANTVRLKEHGHDVLVLEKINTTYGREAVIDPYTGEPLAPRQHCWLAVSIVYLRV
uniref:Uncharacterized protein n=1 Tax=Parascaris equorum TaxID=6256 RepID=A0A914S6R0_PAREQ